MIPVKPIQKVIEQEEEEEEDCEEEETDFITMDTTAASEVKIYLTLSWEMTYNISFVFMPVLLFLFCINLCLYILHYKLLNV